MRVGIYAVKDVKSATFFPPFMSHTPGTAERQFSVNVNDKHENNMLRRYPSDFELWTVGEFDDNTGMVTPREPLHMCTAVDVLEAQGNAS